MVGDVLLELAHGPVVGDLGLELGAELGLVAGPAQEDDQDAGHVAGDVGAEVLLEEGQEQIEAGGDAGRGPHPVRAGEHRSGVHRDTGVALRQQFPEAPMRGGAAPLEEAGRGQDEGTGAQRPDPERPPPEPTDDADEGVVFGGFVG